MTMGRVDESIAMVTIAHEMDPLSSVLSAAFGYASTGAPRRRGRRPAARGARPRCRAFPPALPPRARVSPERLARAGIRRDADRGRAVGAQHGSADRPGPGGTAPPDGIRRCRRSSQAPGETVTRTTGRPRHGGRAARIRRFAACRTESDTGVSGCIGARHHITFRGVMNALTRTMGLVTFVVVVAAACRTAAPVTNAVPAGAQGCTLPPNAPAASAGFTEFANYSWSLFQALNWPVVTGQRGVPDCGRPIGSAGPTVWESYKTAEQISCRTPSIRAHGTVAARRRCD